MIKHHFQLKDQTTIWQDGLWRTRLFLQSFPCYRYPR